jgi:DUF438 domain-containing protein
MDFSASPTFDLTGMAPFILDRIPIGVTVIDLEGRMLYFNDYSSKIRDRKPEYLGRDIRLCHKKEESIDKIDRILEEFKSGRREVFSYQAHVEDGILEVSVSPLEVEGRLVGCVHSMIKKT